MATGATSVTMARFDLGAMLRLIEHHRVTLAFLVPPIVLALARHPAVDGADLSSLRTIVSGAAPLDAAVAAACAERIGCEVIQGYGLTEASPVTHITPRGAGTTPPGLGGAVDRIDRGAGRRRRDGRRAAAGADGEMLVRGPQVMRGYLGNPEATAEAIDPAGWLPRATSGTSTTTVALRRRPAQGADQGARAAGRPGRARGAAARPPGRRRCRGRSAGRTHGRARCPWAYVVLPGDATERELIDHVAARVPRTSGFGRSRVVDEIPRTPSGKILRRVLRDGA